MTKKGIILIAGGTGFIGSRLVDHLRSKGHSVCVLSRNPQKENEFYWNPKLKKINYNYFDETTIIVNVTGEGLADKRWTEKRKSELYESRIGTNEYLYSLKDKFPNLKQYVCASGINCYGYSEPDREHIESDPFGDDFLSQLVKNWEQSANLFASADCNVACVRTAMVLGEGGDALQKLMPIHKIGLASPLGTGQQSMPWIHINDLVGIYTLCVEKGLSGSFNANAGYVSNKKFNQILANSLGKRMFLPNVPAFMIKLIFGEMALILLEGLKVSNKKIIDQSFKFEFASLEQAFENIVKTMQ